MLKEHTKSITPVKRNEAAIEKILSAPPETEGNRHGDAIRRLHQLRANGAGREEAVQAVLQLYPAGSGKHRKVSIEEFYTAYDGAEKLPLEPWSTSHRPLRYHRAGNSGLEVNCNKFTYTHDGSAEELPPEEIKHSFSEFLKFLGFREDEYAIFATKEDAYGDEKFLQWKKGNLVGELTHRPPNECSEGDFLPSIDDHSGEGFSDLGTFFAVNPFKTGDSRKPDNISRFLYTMVESDTLSREEQLALFKRSGLPIKCLIDTGSKSVHAIIKIDAANADEYKDRVERIHEYLGGKEAGFDSTKDPVRFSRLPNCEHNKGRQRLISLQLGAASWAAWESSNQTSSTEGFDLDSLTDFDRENDPNCMIGDRWLCKGGSCVIQGYSGIGKSSFTLQMALRWSAGLDFFGLEPVRPLKTVFVQAENDRGDFAEQAAGLVCFGLAIGAANDSGIARYRSANIGSC
jgi:hypothetical protein